MVTTRQFIVVVTLPYDRSWCTTRHTTFLPPAFSLTCWLMFKYHSLRRTFPWCYIIVLYADLTCLIDFSIHIFVGVCHAFCLQCKCPITFLRGHFVSGLRSFMAIVGSHIVSPWQPSCTTCIGLGVQWRVHDLSSLNVEINYIYYIPYIRYSCAAYNRV